MNTKASISPALLRVLVKCQRMGLPLPASANNRASGLCVVGGKGGGVMGVAVGDGGFPEQTASSPPKRPYD